MDILLSRARGRRSRKLIAISSALIVILSYLPNPVLAAAGDLDSTFGMGGKVTTGPASGAKSLAIQADGKIVVVGSVGSFDAVRFNSDGTLDSSFGIGGRVIINFFSFPGSQEAAHSVAIQPDGKIVIAGYATFLRLTFALIRLNSDGSLDLTFGVAGKVRTDFAPFDSAINAIALQPDGKIVAAGFRAPRTKNGSDFALARYNADGTLDTTFGSAGKVETDFKTLDDVVNAIVVQPDGRIVAAGYDNVTTFADFLFDYAVARYNSDGSLDASFGIGGKVTTNFFGRYDEARAVAIQLDGRLVVGGAATNTSFALNQTETDFGLVRYNTDGSLDATFGTGGKVMTDFLSEFDQAQALAIQPNGKIVAAGLAELGRSERTDFVLARYNTDGSLDGAFGSSGTVRTDFFGFNDSANAIGLQSDGKIVAAGFANNVVQGQFEGYIALARYDGVNFDICLKDDSNGNILQFNSTTGDYQFTNCRGFTLGGTGVLTRRGGIITLQQNGSDRRVLARIDGSVNRGTASVQVPSTGITFTITDRNTHNNTCSCDAH